MDDTCSERNPYTRDLVSFYTRSLGDSDLDGDSREVPLGPLRSQVNCTFTLVVGEVRFEVTRTKQYRRRKGPLLRRVLFWV